MGELKIRKIGNSLGVILPKEVQDKLQVEEGDFIQVTEFGENKIILENGVDHHSKWVFKNSENDSKDSEWLDAELEGDHETPSW